MTTRLLCLFVSLAGLVGAAQQPTFRSTASSVAIDVSVKSNGKPITGLAASDFRLTDRGVVQTISHVERQRLPVDLTLIADLVGSVEGAWLEGFRRAFETVRGNVRDNNDRLRMVLFDPRIQEIQGLEHATVRFDASTQRFDGGASALFDTIAMSLIRETDPSYRRMAIVLTEGQDGGSFLDEPELMDVAARTDVVVFVIALTDGTKKIPLRPAHERMLKALADITGGALTIVQRDADLGVSFVGELDDFRTSYVLHYTPTSAEAPGWHDVEVRVNRRADVRARKGYFGEAAAR